MLQQTTVVSAAPYFRDFLDRWPSVDRLAAAQLDEVLTRWAGLGYYARARNLHRCAREVVARHGGRFPQDEEELRQLPGIGAYTAAAIRAIAFGLPATAVDGNVERVVARLFDLRTPMPAAKPELRALAARLVPDRRPGDYTQAMMDLGATLCVPRTPRCVLCPLQAPCRARAAGSAADLPAKIARPEKPVRRGIAFWTLNPAGDILLRRRPEKGLLGGMMEVPSTPWGPARPSLAAAAAEAPVAAEWRPLAGEVRHTFTHFHLELGVVHGRAGADWQGADGIWVSPLRLGEQALPTVMRKIVRLALAGA
jgi:A/G-specific adenine glycosylase